MKKLNIKNWKHINCIRISCSILKKGGIIVYPTDTVYGLGCDATNENAIKKINLIKNRQAPISVMTHSTSIISNWITINNKYKDIVLKKFKSSNTFIVPIKKNIVSNLIVGKNNSLGIRIPKHKFCKKLTKYYPNPITTTSVNRTGEKPFTNPELIIKYFQNEINLIVEDGILDNKASKIFIFDNNKFILLRS
tara:strand:- start:376 stop:954 length:579 start_codon:yes stop_codon:yes gene_type:complete